MRDEKILSEETHTVILSPRGDSEESRLKNIPSLKKISSFFFFSSTRTIFNTK